mgnify:CR=1 FL=1
MSRFRASVAIAVLIAAVAATPATAAVTKVGTLGQVTFAARLSALDASAASSLQAWLPSLRGASAVRLDSYGGTRAVARATASARAAARGNAVKAWLAARGVTARITVVNKMWWPGRPGADKGNRLVVVITALKPAVVPTNRSVTVTYTSDFDAPPQGESAVCNYTPVSAQVSQGAGAVATSSTFSAVSGSTCTWRVTLAAVPLNKASTVTVSFQCNDSGDGIPAEELCFAAEVSVAGATLAMNLNDATGDVSLVGEIGRAHV